MARSGVQGIWQGACHVVMCTPVPVDIHVYMHTLQPGHLPLINPIFSQVSCLCAPAPV